MSTYFKSLFGADKARYLQKLCQLFRRSNSDSNSFCDEDPFLEECWKWSNKTDDWPLLEFGQIYAYLIDSHGLFTQQTLKAYKSLEAYNFFASGWVQPCFHRTTAAGMHVIKAKVLRSQALSKPPHQAWVGLKPDGSVINAHCTCMAG